MGLATEARSSRKCPYNEHRSSSPCFLKGSVALGSESLASDLTQWSVIEEVGS